MNSLGRISLSKPFAHNQLRVPLVMLTLAVLTNSGPTFAQKKVSTIHPDKLKAVSPPSKIALLSEAMFKHQSEDTMGHCRSLFMQQDYRSAEALLKKELPTVRNQGSRESILPRYLGVIGSCCYFQKRYKEADTYIQEALKVNDSLPEGKRITRTALFSNNAYLGLSLQELEQYKSGSEHLRKAIELSEGLPAIDRNWLRVVYQGMIYCLRRQGKYEEVLKYKERMSKIK